MLSAALFCYNFLSCLLLFTLSEKIKFGVCVRILQRFIVRILQRFINAILVFILDEII